MGSKVFLKPMQTFLLNNAIISAEEIEMVFSNIEEIFDCNSKFLNAIELSKTTNQSNSIPVGQLTLDYVCLFVSLTYQNQKNQNTDKKHDMIEWGKLIRPRYWNAEGTDEEEESFFVVAYRKYINNFNTSNSTIQQLLATKPVFKQFVEVCFFEFEFKFDWV